MFFASPCCRNATGSSVVGTCGAADPNAQRLCRCYFGGQCPAGWTVYRDNGVEGHDSCLMYNSTVVPFATASAFCPSGSHLVTVKAANTSISLLYNSILLLSNFYVSSTKVWLGATQARLQPYKNYGWSWIDGTNATNLYNGVNNVTAYGLWTSSGGAWAQGQPE